MKNHDISQLLSKELTRKEFLVYIGSVFLTLVGITHFINSLSLDKKQPSSQSSQGFGSGAYGGGPKQS
jgi:hypothetical protein